MAWDSSRPVVWRRLFRDWVTFVIILTVLAALFARHTITAQSAFSVLLTLPIAMGVGWVLAKFGYQRKTLADLRAESPPRGRTASTAASSPAAARSKPAPTRRTGGGGRPGSRPGGRRR